MYEEVQTEKSVRGALWREIVTDDTQVFYLKPKTFEGSHANQGDILYTAHGKYLDHFIGHRWVVADFNCLSHRDHRVGSTCIQNHLQSFGILGSHNLAVERDDIPRNPDGGRCGTSHGTKMQPRTLEEGLPRNRPLKYFPYASPLPDRPHLYRENGPVIVLSRGSWFFHPSHQRQSKATHDGTGDAFHQFFAISQPIHIRAEDIWSSYFHPPSLSVRREEEFE